MIIQVLITLAVGPLFLVRWLRWVAIVQQKEYRIDRLSAFFHSSEGREEAKKILPKKSELTRTGLKRPRPTSRVMFVAALSILSMFVAYVFSLALPFGFWIFSLVLLYVFTPVFVIFSCLPSSLLSWLLTQRVLLRAQRKLRAASPQIIGVGGSYGKSSTKHLLHHFLSQEFTVFVTPKSFNTKLSVASSICEGYTNQQIALLEYGAYIRGEIEYLANWFQPQIAIETGFTPQHLSLFGTRENSILAESELLAALPKDGTAFCNGADSGAVEICEVGLQKSNAKLVMYAGDDGVVQLKNVTLNAFGQASALWKGQKLETQLIGRQYMINLQAAIAVSEHLQLSDQQIINAARSFRPNSSFIQGKVLQTGAYLVDDGGTSNPKGFSAALDIIEELPYKQKILITAGMIDLGDESDQIHLELAQRAHQMGLQVIHLGVDGKEQFNQVFGERLVTSTQAVIEILRSAGQSSAILLEGKVPKVLEDYLEESTERML
jgi:UDP-N-acetylmuramoyl-tripeptide--D-alanyl-D-alanine ligase